MQLNSNNSVKVQLAFQGGGAKIFALIAAAKAIQEMEDIGAISVTRVAGTSAGSIVASMYAAKIPWHKMKEYFNELPSIYYSKIKEELNTLTKQLSKVTNGSYFKNVLTLMKFKRLLPIEKPIVDESILKNILLEIEELKDKNINDLAIPLIITKTDIEKHKNVVSSRESKVVNEIVHSCRIPFFFGDGSVNAEFYDGGITNNLATNYLIDDADKFGTVIAITFENKGTKTNNIFDRLKAILFSAIDSSVNINLENRKRLFTIELKNYNIGMIDFEKMVKILKGDNNSPFEDNYKIAIEAVKNDFFKNHFSIKESIKSRAYQITTNLTGIEDYPDNNVIIEYPYSDISGVQDMQEKIKKYLLKHKLFKDQDAFDPSIRKDYFDAIQRPEIAVLNKAIYLFPFFLSRLRRNYWGVIDYGFHRAIGLVLTDECSLTDRNQNNFKTYIKKNHEYKITGASPDKSKIEGNGHWIDDLINSIKEKGKLISVNGYLFNELIPLMFMASKNTDALNLLSENSLTIYPHDAYIVGEDNDQYQKCWKDYKKINDSDCPIVKTQFRTHFKMFKRFQENKINESAVIFDLTYKEMVDFILKKLEIEAKVLKTHHYLDVIVGIGFSLPAFEKIDIDNTHWNELKKIAFESLKDENENLLEIGIQLTIN